jgi:hypothetical protein
MIIHSQENNITKGNVGSETQFSIKASAQAFEVLASGLYSNEILAIIRELSANAWDSHVAAGKLDVPIEIQLPTSLDPTFYVKDFGTGLSHDQITTLYTTVFESDKQDSNNFIGGLGLGSKSPFSYASSFIVESRYEGLIRFYSCYKDESDIPTIALMAMQNTDESNGLTIKLSVKQEDIYRFNDNARKALMYYDPMPNVVAGTNMPFSPYAISHTISGSNWKIRDSQYEARMTGPYVVQGFISYPINGSLLREHEMSPLAASLTHTAIDFNMNIGDVDVAASREALKYRPSTIKILIEAFEVAALELYASIQANFSDCKNKWEVGMLYDQFQQRSGYEFGCVFRSFQQNAPFMWNDEAVTNSLTIDVTEIKNTYITTYVKASGRKKVGLSCSKTWVPHQPHKTYNIVVNDNTHIITDTVSKSNLQLYIDYMNNLQSCDHATLIVIRPTSRTTHVPSEINDIVQKIGCSNVVVAERIVPTTPKKKYSYKKKNNSERLRWVGFRVRETRWGRDEVHRVYSKFCWSSETIDLSLGGFYVPVDRFAPIDSAGVGVHFDEFIRNAQHLDIIPDNVPIYGFSKAQVEILDSNSGWINLFDHVDRLFKLMSADGSIYGSTVSKGIIDNIGKSFASKSIDVWDRVGPTIIDGKFKRFLKRMVDCVTAAAVIKYKQCHIRSLVSQLGIKDPSKQIIDQLHEEWWNLVSVEYPMISHTLNGWMDDRCFNDIIQYVNMIENISLTKTLE